MVVASRGRLNSEPPMYTHRSVNSLSNINEIAPNSHDPYLPHNHYHNLQTQRSGLELEFDDLFDYNHNMTGNMNSNPPRRTMNPPQRAMNPPQRRNNASQRSRFPRPVMRRHSLPKFPVAQQGVPINIIPSFHFGGEDTQEGELQRYWEELLQGGAGAMGGSLPSLTAPPNMATPTSHMHAPPTMNSPPLHGEQARASGRGNIST